MARKKKTTRKKVGTKARAAGSTRTPNRTDDEPIEITLRTPDGEIASKVQSGKKLQDAAYRWTYVLRSRTRWRKERRAREDLAEQGRTALLDLGLTEADLEILAQARWIEVSIPYAREARGWEARILPWEYLLSVATMTAGRRHGLTVVRHLDRAGPEPEPFRRPESLSVIASAPGSIKDRFDFTTECAMPERILFDDEPVVVDDDEDDPDADPAVDDPVRLLEDPTLDEIAAHIRGAQPDIVHLCGIDNHQGVDEFEMPQPSGEPTGDGMVLSWQETGSRRPMLAAAFDLARALSGGDAADDDAALRGPGLVVYNIYRSAARTAALTVAEGAGAALGFQDTFDDALAEIFLADFYHALRVSQYDVHLAFATAWHLLNTSGRDLRGSGVVLWSARSIAEIGYRNPERRVAELAELVREPDREVLHVNSASRARELVKVTVEPKTRINYSLLHNNRPLFEKFELRRKPGRVEDVEVIVQLHAGDEAPRYRSVLSLNEPVEDLREQIFLPLTWMRDGGFWENVRSSLFVQVTWRGFDLYKRTQAVTLLPADEWIDTDENRQSLPSFVYPRDPAVGRVIAAAQEILMGLADDPQQGFDGYQSVDREADDPTELVDLQVQAIWQALTHDLPLGYINPPPSFSESAQRLRTPSEVIDGRRGTCIDLTLLLASCLEYVEIYPVLLLLQGHAFPGYWRSEDAYHDFMIPRSGEREESPSVWQRSPWLVEGEAAYHEVVRQVHEGHLVPLESVWLTQRASFWDAVEEGWENLRVASEFHSLIDVLSARNHDVTPLPIRGMRE